ncbi:hypothetical protein GCM10011519_07150 [Marmoricola endophyticus]|uniref:Mechanosensitive ion channel MscS domain-containing protein n=1 Tax=Marmoricola endophyticus TaxID=2040280 RepID=A0A917F1Q7_9ACTN|nr:mechanosensitive ion channel domain-containing protein [Marmoricola endophyticus]GGF36217.1 hypothetical protein GCM10011519_07150 [Marmoricola endophyticus]
MARGERRPQTREALRRLEGRLDEHIRLDLRRAVGFGALAVVALAVGHALNRAHPDLDRARVASYACAALVLVLGVLATRSAASEVTRVVSTRSGAAAGPLRFLIQVVGYLLIAIAVLDVVGVDLSQFLVGGAVTGVVIGIAAQQSLGNFFAGLVLLIARPYTAGETITVWSGALGGPHCGVVLDAGLLYTTLDCDGELLRVPNSGLLASAITPGRSVRLDDTTGGEDEG